MSIDLAPNNQQIKPENMAKYPDHKEWPYESLRTITEMISPSTTGDPYDAVYGDPIEHNIHVYKHDISMGLAVDIDIGEFEMFIPEFYLKEGRSSIAAHRLMAMRHSSENTELIENLLEENKIKVPPQYQYYQVSPDEPSMLDIRLKFESKADADAWIEAKA